MDESSKHAALLVGNVMQEHKNPNQECHFSIADICVRVVVVRSEAHTGSDTGAARFYCE